MTHLADLASRLATRRVIVIGDVMLDHFLIGHVDRISPEAPVPVVRFDRDEYRLGGAANVAHNLAALGGQATLIGLAGQDVSAEELCAQLRIASIDARGLVRDPARPTTRKTRIVTSRNQQVARVDYERDEEARGDVLTSLLRQITSAAPQADSIVLSDYRKGVVTGSVIATAVAAAAKQKIPLLVDPKLPDAAHYRGATLLTPNHHEAELMTHRSIRSIEDIKEAARLLHTETGASVLITWGEHGMWVLDGSTDSLVEESLPAVAREVADVTGAGDTVIAVLALALASGARLVEAARLANIAAGLVVAKFGPAAVTSDQLLAAVRATTTD